MGKIQPNAAAPAAPAASSKPGTKDASAAKPAKKAKVKRQYYPGLNAKPVIEDGKPKLSKKGKEIVRPTTLLKEVPKDFDIKLHKPLREADFEDPSLWYELKAQDYERKAAQMREQGATVKSLGSKADRGAAKKLVQLQKRMDDMIKDLEGKGVDVSAIKAKVAADLAKKAEKKAEGGEQPKA